MRCVVLPDGRLLCGSEFELTTLIAEVQKRQSPFEVVLLLGAMLVAIAISDGFLALAAIGGVAAVIVLLWFAVRSSRATASRERALWFGVDGVLFPERFARHDQIASATVDDRRVVFEIRSSRGVQTKTLTFVDAEKAEEVFRTYRARRTHFERLTATEPALAREGYRQTRVEGTRTEVGRLLMGELWAEDADDDVVEAIRQHLAEGRE